ncbi:malate synthase [Salmonella enterica subsp. enterica]|uniref:Malate synthase n=1 Tax=Salmonella enterica I TaxID=59201 RepID=A0A379X3S1_SALET|nr:malate synthase [Salmonella enterica subsp. enterica]
MNATIRVLAKVKADKALEANNRPRRHVGLRIPGWRIPQWPSLTRYWASTKIQLFITRDEDAPITAEQLLEPCEGERTEAGMRANIRVASAVH